jgi:hypothetical protein
MPRRGRYHLLRADVPTTASPAGSAARVLTRLRHCAAWPDEGVRGFRHATVWDRLQKLLLPCWTENRPAGADATAIAIAGVTVLRDSEAHRMIRRRRKLTAD